MTKARCANCGKHLSPENADPCPNCGSEEREVIVTLQETAVVDENIAPRTLREFWERNWPILSTVTAVAVGSPFLGLFLAGWTGVWIGLPLSLFSLIAGFFSVTKVREITRH